MVICYDFRFGAYLDRLVRDHHIDVILHPVAFSRDETFASWHPFAVTRAMENQVFYLSLNRAGPDYGESIACKPWNDGTGAQCPQVFGDDEDFRVVEVTHREIEASRKQFPLRRDRLSNYRDLLPPRGVDHPGWDSREPGMEAPENS